MKRGLQRTGASAGFTIVETMIVLAVTGVLFVTIAMSWAGRQHAQEFSVASHDIVSQVGQVISEVQNGYFPDASAVSCTPGGSGPIFATGSAADTQGTRKSCIFLGKAIQFFNSDPQQYRVYTIAGLFGGTSIAAAKPQVAAPTPTSSSFPDFSAMHTLKYGLKLVAMDSTDVHGATAPVDALAFLSSNATNGGASSGLTPEVKLYAIKAPLGSLTQLKQAAADMNNKLGDPYVAGQENAGDTVRMCFQSGGTNQFAEVTFKAQQPLSPVLRITTDNNCGWS